MKKRKLIKKIAREGCEDVDCHECSFIGHDGACSLPGDTAVVFAKQWLVAHLKEDKPCPRCGGSGRIITDPYDESDKPLVAIACPLCLGTGKRITRADLEAEVVRLREGK
jgi:hypothetical protein